jgi:hypothetical protein
MKTETALAAFESVASRQPSEVAILAAIARGELNWSRHRCIHCTPEVQARAKQAVAFLRRSTRREEILAMIEGNGAKK